VSLAQATSARLGEASRKNKGGFFLCFRSGESHSPRRKYQITNLFPHEGAQILHTQINHSPIHAIQTSFQHLNM